MFHKEKLLERLAATVPAKYTKLCAIDCDVLFAREDWYDAVSVALDTTAAVQPFSRCNWMAADFRKVLSANPSAATQIAKVRDMHARKQTDRLTGHPGFALAMRREVSQFLWAVVGGGDSVFYRGVNGLCGEFMNPRVREIMRGAWEEWSAVAKGWGGLGFVEGDIWHMWHGPMSGRQYYDRYAKFAAVVPAGVKDVRELLIENADGVWEWREDVRSALNTMMLRYFSGRDDDTA
jgi:hypothetical protein